MGVTVKQFVEKLVRSRLMSAEEAEAFRTGTDATSNAEDLARALVRAGKLTKYQVKEIWQGHGDSLAMGEYVILDEIGAGGMGKVLKAQHRRMERIVALKVLSSKLVDSPEALKRFQREVKAAARLEHPNIVTAYDAGESKGTHYLVMQYVRGTDLSHIIKQKGLFTVEQAVDCTIQAARGLEYAHSQGVIHRDIKPSNLLLDEKGTVKILDMGLARIERQLGADGGGADDEKLTSTGMAMGTCDYMAPEQAEDTHAADHRADIYSLGCTLYRLLTGKPPYQGDTHVKVILGHIRDPIPSLRTLRLDVPEELDAVFQKMLAKRPEDRYQSMTTVIEAIQACMTPVSDSQRVRSEKQSSDAALTSFLEGLAQVGPKGSIAKMASPRHEDTMGSRIEQDTATGLPQRIKRTLSAAGRWPVLMLGVGGAAAIAVVALGFTWSFWRPSEAIQKVTPAAEVESEQPGEPVKDAACWALHFDGVKDFVRTDLSYDGKTPITIESLVKITRPQYGSLVGNINQCGLALSFISAEWVFAVHDGTDYRRATSDDPPAVNVWVHVAGMFDAKSVVLYVDGKQQRVASSVEMPHKPAPWPFMIAADPMGGPTPEHFLPACVAALRISSIVRYDKDFTPAERFEADKDTLALYHFDEGTGDVLHDASGNGHDGKIVGATWVGR